MDYIRYANQGAVRSQPLSPELVDALSFLADLGVQAEVFSGGQAAKGSGGPRTGSVRHDHGNAADVFFLKDGRRLDWANPDDLPIFQEIVRRGKAGGLTGFGAGPGYMQQGAMHIGFGDPAVWGAKGKGANAPDWLREAYGMAPSGQPRISTQGAVPMDAQQAPQQRGLLGLFGPREDDPRSPAERRRDILANLAIGLSGMSMFPNTGMINALQGGVQERREARKEAAAAERALQSKSRTVEWLRSPGVGRPDLAAAVETGALGGQDAAALALQQPKDDRTALIKNYEYAKQSGYPGSFDEFLRSGGGGGSVVNVGTGADESALQKELGKRLGTDVATSIKAGQQARRNIARYDVLEQLLQSAPQGGAGVFVQMASNFGLKLEGASDVEAAQALINQLVPEQRQPGSGPMSDADLALFKQSLPRIINTPGGNELILQTLRGIANYDMQAGQIAQRLASGEIDVRTYLREMASLENPIPPVIRQQAPESSMTGDDAANILLGR
jgi:hypothetical protein